MAQPPKLQAPLISHLNALVSRIVKGKPSPQRSIVFLHNAYYNFFHLARALRERGWNAIAVSVDPVTHPDYRFYHGEDLNLWHQDPIQYKKNLDLFIKKVKREFKMVHFYGMGRMSFYPQYWDIDSTWSVVPLDIVELKKAGVKLGYTHSGCLDMVSQTTFYKWSGGTCDKCIYQGNTDVCSDYRNLAWGSKVHQYCDLICTETEPVIDYKSGPKVYREPLTYAIDKEVWSENLTIPQHLRFEKQPGEIVVYHAVGNYKSRSNETRNIKGTPAVVRAIDSLQQKGHKVSLRFVTDVPSRDIRFIQAQCDILVDQLNYGRYGATAREGMMLGKPTLCMINPKELIPGVESACILETPLVNASEETVEKVLEDLIIHPEKRQLIGQQSRAHAIKWWSAEACAEQFEQVYDRLLQGLPVSDLPLDI